MTATPINLHMLLITILWIAFLISVWIAKRQWDAFQDKATAHKDTQTRAFQHLLPAVRSELSEDEIKSLADEVGIAERDMWVSMLKSLGSLVVATGLFLLASSTSYAYACSLDPGMPGRPDRIVGFVYQDNAPANGQRDSGEAILPNVEVFLMDSGNSQHDVATTEPNGFFEVVSTAADAYTLATGAGVGAMGVPEPPGPYELGANTNEVKWVDIGVP